MRTESMMSLRVVGLQFLFEKIEFYNVIRTISRYPSYAYIICVVEHGCSRFNFQCNTQDSFLSRIIAVHKQQYRSTSKTKMLVVEINFKKPAADNNIGSNYIHVHLHALHIFTFDYKFVIPTHTSGRVSKKFRDCVSNIFVVSFTCCFTFSVLQIQVYSTKYTCKYRFKLSFIKQVHEQKSF